MDKVKYVNRLGTELDMRSREIMSSYLALKDFVQSFDNSKLVSGGKTVKLPVVCLTKSDANRLIDTLEKDSAVNEFGKLYINDWYIRVIYQGMRIIAERDERVKLEISLYAEDTIFTRETEKVLFSTSSATGNGLNFPYNFPYNLMSNSVSATNIENKEVLDADFIVKIVAITPNINLTIGGNAYVINASLSMGETLVLNTAEKEVYKQTSTGNVSLLGATDDNSYIFAMIPSGVHSVAWNGSYSIRFTLLEHRRTPKWT